MLPVYVEMVRVLGSSLGTSSHAWTSRTVKETREGEENEREEAGILQSWIVNMLYILCNASNVSKGQYMSRRSGLFVFLCTFKWIWSQAPSNNWSKIMRFFTPIATSSSRRSPTTSIMYTVGLSQHMKLAVSATSPNENSIWCEVYVCFSVHINYSFGITFV